MSERVATAVPVNGTGRLLVLATCTGCGVRGFEELDDVSPGTCPVCFEDIVSAAFGFDLGLSRPADDESAR